MDGNNTITRILLKIKMISALRQPGRDLLTISQMSSWSATFTQRLEKRIRSRARGYMQVSPSTIKILFFWNDVKLAATTLIQPPSQVSDRPKRLATDSFGLARDGGTLENSQFRAQLPTFENS